MTPPDAKLTPVMEDYIKTVYLLAEEQPIVTTSMVALRLGLVPSSVTQMLQRLATHDLVVYTPYQGVVLTPAGQRIARVILRRHRLLEHLLVQDLGYTWDDVDLEADALEHGLSDRLASHIEAFLGFPQADPLGDPIPSAELNMPSRTGDFLIDTPRETPVRVLRVLQQDAAHLHYLGAIGLIPGSIVTVHRRAPLNGPISLTVGSVDRVIDSRIARFILVERAAEL